MRIPGMHRMLAAAATLALFASIALAEDAPKPPAEIQRLTALAGTFEGEAAYTTGGHTLHFTLHHVNRVISAGFGLAVHEEAELPGLGHYEAENLFGWDAGRGRLHLLSVTSDPATHDHDGSWSDATHATLRYEGLRDGRRMVEVIPFEIVSPDEYRFRSTVTMAGRAPEVFEAHLRRVPAMSAR